MLSRTFSPILIVLAMLATLALISAVPLQGEIEKRVCHEGLCGVGYTAYCQPHCVSETHIHQVNIISFNR